MKKKLIKEKLSYAMLIIDLSEEIGISIKETKKIVDTAISIIKPSKIDYNKLKDEIQSENIWETIEVENLTDDLLPFLTTIPLQKLAYYSALQKGYDIDKPRNLAKSVTVE